MINDSFSYLEMYESCFEIKYFSVIVLLDVGKASLISFGRIEMLTYKLVNFEDNNKIYRAFIKKKN